jgi:hypothetical protein
MRVPQGPMGEANLGGREGSSGSTIEGARRKVCAEAQIYLLKDPKIGSP